MLTSAYTTPLVGRPYYKSTGLIKVIDKYDRRFSVGEITLERFDEQNFQYIIKPYWNEIDMLPEGLFQGLPGINMEKRYSSYYRVNITPSFISMRTPSENRENVRELMASAGLDYYDRFEWLLRTEMRCGDDNLIVVRKLLSDARIDGLNNFNDNYLHPQNVVEINSLTDFHSNNSRLIADIYQFLQSGVKIYLREEKRFLFDSERKAMLNLLRNLLKIMDRNNAQQRYKGIQLAKSKGRYVGRKPIVVDEISLNQVYYDFKNKLISEQEAMKKLGLNSRSTFYRKLKTVSAALDC